MFEQFAPINECVYCGETQGKLTNEHILAQSLGGAGLVLGKASCDSCQKLTSFFERQVADFTYGRHRAFQGGPSKKPLSKLKERLSKTEELDAVDFYGKKVKVKVRICDIPLIPMNITFTPPLMLDNTKEEAKYTLSAEGHNEKAHIKFSKMLRVAQISIKSPTINPTAFMKVLAKTGHCYAYAKLGKLRFKPYLAKLILGEENGSALGKYVGGFEEPQPQSKDILSLRIEKVGGKNLVIVDVSIKAIRYLPKYQVICGEHIESLSC